jgi:hypothetical protein
MIGSMLMALLLALAWMIDDALDLYRGRRRGRRHAAARR